MYGLHWPEHNLTCGSDGVLGVRERLPGAVHKGDGGVGVLREVEPRSEVDEKLGDVVEGFRAWKG